MSNLFFCSPYIHPLIQLNEQLDSSISEYGWRYAATVVVSIVCACARVRVLAYFVCACVLVCLCARVRANTDLEGIPPTRADVEIRRGFISRARRRCVIAGVTMLSGVENYDFKE